LAANSWSNTVFKAEVINLLQSLVLN